MRVLEATAGNRFYAHDVDHRGRNFLFELECACLLLDCDIALALSTDGDLAATWDGHRLLGECKRPSSPAGVLRRIAQASDQIEERRKGDDLGVVFVDLTVVVNPELEHYPVESEEHAAALMNQTMRGNAPILYERSIRRLKSDYDAGIYTRLTRPFWYAKELRWLFHSKWMSFPNPRGNALSRAFFEAFDGAATQTLGRF